MKIYYTADSETELSLPVFHRNLFHVSWFLEGHAILYIVQTPDGFINSEMRGYIQCLNAYIVTSH